MESSRSCLAPRPPILVCDPVGAVKSLSEADSHCRKWGSVPWAILDRRLALNPVGAAPEHTWGDR